MSSTSNTTQQRQSVQQWKPNAPQRKEGAAKPKRKDFSEVNSNPETGISLCVPFAFKTVGPKRVFAIFRKPTIITAAGETICDVSLGFIERIDIKQRQDGNKCVFIHFAPGRWNDSDTTREILAAMKDGNPLKVVTDENGHFWKTIISKSQRPADYFEDELEEGGDSTDGQVVEMDDLFA